MLTSPLVFSCLTNGTSGSGSTTHLLITCPHRHDHRRHRHTTTTTTTTAPQEHPRSPHTTATLAMANHCHYTLHLYTTPQTAVSNIYITKILNQQNPSYADPPAMTPVPLPLPAATSWCISATSDLSRSTLVTSTSIMRCTAFCWSAAEEEED